MRKLEKSSQGEERGKAGHPSSLCEELGNKADAPGTADGSISWNRQEYPDLGYKGSTKLL